MTHAIQKALAPEKVRRSKCTLCWGEGTICSHTGKPTLPTGNSNACGGAHWKPEVERWVEHSACDDSECPDCFDDADLVLSEARDYSMGQLRDISARAGGDRESEETDACLAVVRYLRALNEEEMADVFAQIIQLG